MIRYVFRAPADLTFEIIASSSRHARREAARAIARRMTMECMECKEAAKLTRWQRIRQWLHL